MGSPPPRTGRSGIRGRRRRGSLVVSSLCIALMALGALAAVRAVVTTIDVEATTSETAVANAAAASVIDRMSSEPFAQLFVRYDGSTWNDPSSVACPGRGFAVPGLAPVPGDPDGLPGEIVFPLSSHHLSETANGFPGMPRDLNLDGDASDADVDGTYRVLPVIVRVRWRGRGGDRTVSIRTALSEQP